MKNQEAIDEYNSKPNVLEKDKLLNYDEIVGFVDQCLDVNNDDYAKDVYKAPIHPP